MTNVEMKNNFLFVLERLMRSRVSCSVGIWKCTSVQSTPAASNSDFPWTKERPGGRKYFSLSQNMELGQGRKVIGGWQGQF